MLLTCPTCRSGLQVPDGTTAHVRCPSCQTIFPAVTGAAPPSIGPFGGSRPRPAQPAPVPKAAPLPEGYRPPPAKPVRPALLVADQRDEPPVAPPPRKRRRFDEDDGRAADERRELRAAFGRGMWGCRLIYLSLALQGAALLVVVLFLARNAIFGPAPALLVAAGVAGLVAWAAGAVGVGLALAGPPSPGHYTYGIAAAVAVGVHGVLLVTLIAQRPERTGLMGQVAVEQVDLWGQLPTKFDAVSLYLATVAYPDGRFVIQQAAALAIMTGMAELVRLILVTMLLGCLARAAGDDDLVHRCVRAGGIGSFGPGVLALVMFLLFAGLVESGGLDRDVGTIAVGVAVMGVYAVLAGMLVPAMMAARDAADACEFPYQTEVRDLGG